MSFVYVTVLQVVVTVNVKEKIFLDNIYVS